MKNYVNHETHMKNNRKHMKNKENLTCHTPRQAKFATTCGKCVVVHVFNSETAIFSLFVTHSFVVFSLVVHDII